MVEFAIKRDGKIALNRHKEGHLYVITIWRHLCYNFIIQVGFYCPIDVFIVKTFVFQAISALMLSSFLCNQQEFLPFTAKGKSPSRRKTGALYGKRQESSTAKDWSPPR